MMDPITALQTASAVVQVVDFSVKIVGSTYEIYKAADGATQSHIHIKGVASHLQSLCDRLSTASFASAPSSYGANGYAQLLELATKCQEAARDILRLLNTLQIDRSQPFPTWQAFRKAVRGLRKASELDALRLRMDNLRSELTLHLIYMMNNSQSSLAHSIHSLQRQCREMHVEQVNLIRNLQDKLTPKIAEDQLTVSWQFENVLSRLQTDFGAEVNRETWDRLQELAMNLRRYPKMAVEHLRTEPSAASFELLADNLTACMHQHSKNRNLRAGHFYNVLTSEAPKEFQDWQPGQIQLFQEFSLALYQLRSESNAQITPETWNDLQELADKMKQYTLSLHHHNAGRPITSLESLAETITDCLNKQMSAGEFYSTVTLAAQIPFRGVLLEVADRADKAILDSQATHFALNVLETLHFPELPMRHMEIPDAYRTTYSWIYNVKASPFAKWLGSGTGTFWINGKAGSGKSTLMKFLSTEPRTKSALRTWSQGAKLCVLRFYFWNSGYPMQKTQHGLLQSLVFQVFSKCPEVIKAAAPRRWYTPRGVRAEPWSRKELEKTLLAALTHQNPKTRFCFFIDGLDEFEGDDHLLDHYELNEYLISLTQTANVKLCISSRPWHVFEDAFGSNKDHTFKLQDLNRRDLDLYIRGMLEEDVRFQRLASLDRNVEALVAEIRDTADGVFLWVYLVVRSLLRGLSERDDVKTLQRRLRALPRELNGFFKHMLDTIDEVYLEHTARALLMAITAGEPLPVLAYRCMEVEIESAGYAIRDKHQLRHKLFNDGHNQGESESGDEEDDAVHRSNNKPSGAKTGGKRNKHRERAMMRGPSYSTAAVERIAACVSTWCRDLLEVRDNWFDNRTKNTFLQYKVDFLHRTAKDFLLSEPIRQHLVKTTTPGYSSHLTLCRAWLALFKAHGRQRGPDPSEWHGFRDKAADFARQCEKHGQPSPLPEMQALQIAVTVSLPNTSSVTMSNGDGLRKYKTTAGDAQVNRHHLSADWAFLSASVSDSNLQEQAAKHRKRDRIISAFSKKEHLRTASATRA